MYRKSGIEYPLRAERFGGRVGCSLRVAIKTLNAELVKPSGSQKLVKKPDVAHTYVILTI